MQHSSASRAVAGFLLPVLACAVTPGALAFTQPAATEEVVLYVDSGKGKDTAAGSKRRPLESLSAALAKLPSPLTESATIHLAAGTYTTTGEVGMPSKTLELMHAMRPSVKVTIAGPPKGKPAVLGWKGERNMIDARTGAWHLRDLQVGTFDKAQRRGVTVRSPSHVTLENIVFRLRSHSDVGIRATDGGRVSLRGDIRLNEHLHDDAEGETEGDAEDETFCGIIATDHGVVEFVEREGASLSLGNGSLSVSYYGSIRLGCAEARITSRTKSNPFALANGGRIDVRNTNTTLRAVLRNNTPIGPEHDGHILAEDAHITIIGPNDSAIALQKASTFTCNDIELVGEFENTIWATSGSMFVGRFLGDVTKVQSKTGAQVLIEDLAGEFEGPAIVESGGLISVKGKVYR